MKHSQSLLAAAMAGTFGAALLLGAGAQAQPRDEDPDTILVVESVLVHPFNVVHTQPAKRSASGALNPVTLSISRPVDVRDLDLSNHSDMMVLHLRIERTARDLCRILDSKIPGTSDREATRQCVTTATTKALQDALG